MFKKTNVQNLRKSLSFLLMISISSASPIIFVNIFSALPSKQRVVDEFISFFVDIIDMLFGIVPWLLFKQLFSIEIEPLTS